MSPAPAADPAWVDTVTVHRSPINDRVWVPLPAVDDPTGDRPPVPVHAGSLAEVKAWAARTFAADADAIRWRAITSEDGARDQHTLQVGVVTPAAPTIAAIAAPTSPDADPVPVLPSPREVRAARSAASGWSRADLARWGVPWPPPKGWAAELERRWTEANPADGDEPAAP